MDMGKGLLTEQAAAAEVLVPHPTIGLLGRFSRLRLPQRQQACQQGDCLDQAEQKDVLH